MARRIIAALLIVVSCLLAPLALGGYWAQHTLTDTATFNETLAPLADDPLVRQTVATEATSAIIDAVDAQARAEKALGSLSGPLADIRPNDSVIAAAIASGVNNAITSGVDSYVNGDRFGDAWLTISTGLQKRFVALIERDTTDAAVTLVDGQIVLNTKLALDKVQAELVERQIPFAGTLDIPGRDVVLADTPNLQLAADALAIFLPVASWLWVVVLVMLIVGVLLWRPRARGLLWAGLGIALGAAVTYFVLDLGSAQLASNAPQGFASLVSVLITTLLRFLVNALLVMLALGIAIALAGLAGRGHRVRSLGANGDRWGRPPLGSTDGCQRTGSVHLGAPDVHPDPAGTGDRSRCGLPDRPSAPESFDCGLERGHRGGRPAGDRGGRGGWTGMGVRPCRGADSLHPGRGLHPGRPCVRHFESGAPATAPLDSPADPANPWLSGPHPRH